MKLQVKTTGGWTFTLATGRDRSQASSEDSTPQASYAPLTAGLAEDSRSYPASSQRYPCASSAGQLGMCTTDQPGQLCPPCRAEAQASSPEDSTPLFLRDALTYAEAARWHSDSCPLVPCAGAPRCYGDQYGHAVPATYGHGII